MTLAWYHWLQLGLLLASLGTGCYTLYLCYLDCRDATMSWLAGYNAETTKLKGEDHGRRDRRPEKAAQAGQ